MFASFHDLLEDLKHMLSTNAKFRAGARIKFLCLMLKLDDLNGPEVTRPSPLDSCPNSVHKLGVDVQIA